MDIKKYFDRLGLEYSEDLQPNSELLKKLHLAHVMTVPYENYDMMRSVPTALDEESLYRKIVEQGRGGLCFELNGSFGNLLRALGYEVTDLAARYLRGEAAIPMRRHRVLKVRATDGLWLCDVGIGEVAQREPIALAEGFEQHQFGEIYKLTKEDFLGWVLWDFHKGAWRKFYSFTEEPQLPVDFEAGNFWCEKHPTSPFNTVEMFALKTPDGRKTLDGHTYKEFCGDSVTVKELTETELPEYYSEFGLKRK